MEQFSRAAYTNGDLEGSPIIGQFAKTFVTKQGLIPWVEDLEGETGERIVAPDETFQTWLDKADFRPRPSGQPGSSNCPRVKKAQEEDSEKAGLARPGSRTKAKKKEAIPPPKEETGVRSMKRSSWVIWSIRCWEYGHLSEKQAELFRERIERGNLQHVQETLQRVLRAELNRPGILE